jgi:hypothetical protein
MAWKISRFGLLRMTSVVLRSDEYRLQIFVLRSRLMQRGLYLRGSRAVLGPRLTVKLENGPDSRQPPPVPGPAPKKGIPPPGLLTLAPLLPMEYSLPSKRGEVSTVPSPPQSRPHSQYETVPGVDVSVSSGFRIQGLPPSPISQPWELTSISAKLSHILLKNPVQMAVPVEESCCTFSQWGVLLTESETRRLNFVSEGS